MAPIQRTQVTKIKTPETKYIYFKRNVNFSVGLRFFPRDPDGIVLTQDNPYVSIPEEDLKDFLQANKISIQKGLILQIDEPSFDFVDENTISDEQAVEMVKNLFILKKKLPIITSEATLVKLYDEAKRQKRSNKIIELIEDRLLDVTPAAMQGIEWGTETDEDSGGE